MAIHYILDGYNIIHQIESLSEKKLENAREALIDLIERERPQGNLKNKVTIVFDGQAGIWSRQERSLTEVLFTSDETADTKIKRLVEESPNKKTMMIVSDDREIQYYVRSLGSKVLGVNEFLAKCASQRQDSQHKSKSLDGDNNKKENISRTLEHKITNELKELWLKKNKEE